MSEPIVTPKDVVAAVRGVEEEIEQAVKSAIHNFTIVLEKKSDLERIGIIVDHGYVNRIMKALRELEPVYDSIPASYGYGGETY